MTTIDVKDAEGATQTIQQPLAPGQAAMAASRPVVIASDQTAVAVKEADGANVTLGAQADAAAASDSATGSVQALFKRLLGRVTSFMALFPSSLTGSGNFKVAVVEGSGGNSAASATGSAVPAAADYAGVNIGGNLVGRTGATVSGKTVAHTDISSVGGAAYALGATTGSASKPVVIATDDATIGAKTETAPASDTASSGLNGRFQRLAQRITSLIALIPSVLGANASSNSLSVAQATDDVMIGSRTETAPATDTALSGLNGRFQRLAQRITSLMALLPTVLGANASSNSLSVAQATDDVMIGSRTETAPASDTASSGLNGRFQRLAQRITSLMALFPSALGATTQSGSLPVVLPTDPDYRPASGNITVQDTGSATAAGQNGTSVITGTPTAGSFQTWAINGQSSVGVLVSNVWTGTQEFNISYDNGTTYFPMSMRVRGSSYTQSQITANGNFSGDVSGATHFRVRAAAAMTGTATIKPTFAATAGPIQIVNPLRLFDNSSGAQASIKPASTAPLTTDTALVVGSAQLPSAVGQAAMAASFAVAIASDQSTILVGGNAAVITQAPAVTVAAYTAGNVIGGLLTFASAARIAAGSGLVQSAVVDAKIALSGQYDLILFDSNPTGSTITDKTALAVVAADFDKIIGVAHIADWTSLGTPSLGQAQNLAMPFKLGSGTTIYGALVTRVTPTFVSTSDVEIQLRILQN